MSLQYEQVLEQLYAAVDELNEQLPAGERLEKSPEVLLFDPAGKLDSLGLVSLIVQVEQNISNVCGTEISITDSLDADGGLERFRTIDSLGRFICGLLEGGSDAG